LAGDVAEGSTEGAEAGPSGSERDFGNRQVGVAEQGGRLLDPPREQVSVGRHAERLLERPREVRFGRAADPRKTGNRPGLVRSCVHPIPGAKKTTQEQRVLSLIVLIGLGIGHSWRRNLPQHRRRVNQTWSLNTDVMELQLTKVIC
jgi:hypothetical protein